MIPLFQTPINLALRDLRHDWLAAMCFVAALVGVLAPLLILLALKNGVIGTMVTRLIEDPANREIIAMGTSPVDNSFFERFGAREDVAFLLPSTRRINASANAMRNPVDRSLTRAVPLIPSASGDPLIGALDAQVDVGKLWLSDSLAKALNTAPGQTVEMLIGRDIDDNREIARRSFLVQGVLAEGRYGRDAAFVALPDLLAIERFRDDRNISQETFSDPRPAPETYAGFRLYAKELSGLKNLISALEEEGIQARARAENVTVLLLIRDKLNVLYAGIALIACLGFWASMAANLRGMVERQRVSFSLLRILGLSPMQAMRIPLVQSCTLVLGGVMVSLILVLPLISLINLVFANAAFPAIAQLRFAHILGTLLLGVFTAASAALWAMRAVIQIDTDEVLRHG